MSDQCGIYKITNTINGKVIVGQSKHMQTRWKQYLALLRHNKHSNPHLQFAWNKYGEANFKFDMILCCPYEDLNKEEIRLILEHNSTNKDFGYNIEPGGNVHNQSEETRKKLSKARKGKHLSEEIKQKLRIASTGKHPSEETRKKLGKTWIGKRHSEESIKKMIDSHTAEKNPNWGKQFSEEHRKRISESQKGEKGNMFGKHHSEEIKNKMRESHLGYRHSEESKRKMAESYRLRHTKLDENL